ncbi:LOW QUALITY PROTEIN: Sentrin-specific protease 3 [Frankliniella fusca]|uniref:Sentrin-specific protease 3 n=1 Tax=Frankliniella fusca TaxID=407009 RepID=A0AAE1HFA1_9NEOP|nr:LOW QUALITY PROTEIN: Sentrin-specific protease 3 [Frankliniella fusca]
MAEEDKKQPTSSTNKPEIVQWLRREGIPFDEAMLKPELLALVQLHRKPKKYMIDTCLESTEHVILRLPPYHACFNPIELVWGLVKRYFDAHIGRNHDYSEKMMLTIFEEALATVTRKYGRESIEKRIVEAYETELKNEDPDNPFQMVITLDRDDMELACGFSFDEFSPKDSVQATSSAASLRPRHTKRSLFGGKCPSRSQESGEVLAVIPEELEFQAISSDNDETGIVQDTTAIIENAASCIGSENPNLVEDREDAVGSQGGYVWYEPVDSSVSHAWWMIPPRCVSQDEVKVAVCNILINGGEDDTNFAYKHHKAFLDENCNEIQALQPECSLDENHNVISQKTHPSTETKGNRFCNIDQRSMEVFSTSLQHERSLDENQNVTSEKTPPKIETKGDVECKIDLKSLEVFNIPSRQVVDKYFKLIKGHYSNSRCSIHVYTSSFYKFVIVLNKGDASFAQNDDPFSYDVVFIPIHMSSLWGLSVVWPRLKKVKSYSSFGETNSECLDAVLNFLALEHRRLYSQTINWLGWSTEEVTDLVKDHNIEDSPVLMCMYGRRVCENLTCDFGTETMAEVRRHMVQELKMGRLLNLNLPPAKVSVPSGQAKKERGSIIIHEEVSCIPLMNACRVFGVDKECGSMKLCNSKPEKTTLEDALKIFDADGGDSGAMNVEFESEPVSEAVMLSSSEDEEPTPVKDFTMCTHSEVCSLAPDTVVSSYGQWHVTANDMNVLQPGGSLNDQVINMYLMLLAAFSSLSVHVLPSQFYQKLMKGGHNMVKSWTNNKRTKVDIFTFDMLLIPIHLTVHWALVVVNFKERTVTYYDSKPNRLTIPSNHILNYLSQESATLGRGELDCAWRHGCATGIPRQANNDDCGVFVGAFAKCLTQLSDCWTFKHSDMLDIRHTIFTELMQKSITTTKKNITPQNLWPPSEKPIIPLPYTVPIVKGAVLIQSGKLHQKMSCFPEDRRNSQCTAIAACAIIAFTIVQRIFSSLEMDSIVLMGDELYVQCRTHARPVNDVWLAPDDIASMGIVTVFGKSVKVDIEYACGGSYKSKDRSYVLSDCLQQEKNKNINGYPFVGRSKTISFWPVSGDDFFLFNSHCVNKDNTLQQCSDLGASRLFGAQLL